MKEKPTIVLTVQGDVNLVLKPLETGETSAGHAPQQPAPDICLNAKRISKIDFIRLLYSLCKNDSFVDSYGQRVPDNKVFHFFGQLLHLNLDNYLGDMNSALQKGKTDTKHLKIFKTLMEIMKDRYNRS
ncbi:MAG: hypothetical protein IKW32_03410 [Bacteroidaceae bacterium]|nr:hypothetical protein [Bacteroidaceae bacterium]